MPANIKQVYDNNPSITLPATALLYAGLDPFGTGDDTAILVEDLTTQVLGTIPETLTAYQEAIGVPVSGTIPDGPYMSFDDSGNPVVSGGRYMNINDGGGITVANGASYATFQMDSEGEAQFSGNPTAFHYDADLRISEKSLQIGSKTDGVELSQVNVGVDIWSQFDNYGTNNGGVALSLPLASTSTLSALNSANPSDQVTLGYDTKAQFSSTGDILLTTNREGAQDGVVNMLASDVQLNGESILTNLKPYQQAIEVPAEDTIAAGPYIGVDNTGNLYLKNGRTITFNTGVPGDGGNASTLVGVDSSNNFVVANAANINLNPTGGINLQKDVHGQVFYLSSIRGSSSGNEEIKINGGNVVEFPRGFTTPANAYLQTGAALVLNPPTDTAQLLIKAEDAGIARISQTGGIEEIILDGVGLQTASTSSGIALGDQPANGVLYTASGDGRLTALQLDSSQALVGNGVGSAPTAQTVAVTQSNSNSYNFTGGGANTAVTIKAEKIGNIVNLKINGFDCTTNGSSMIVSVNALPAAFRPATPTLLSATIQSGTFFQASNGTLAIGTDGIMSIAYANNANDFPPGTGGLGPSDGSSAQCFTYSVT